MKSLPWVDEATITADVDTQLVSFRVPDMTRYDEPALLDAFAKVNFPNTKVLHKPAAP